MSVTESKNLNETPFRPYQTHPHADHLGSFVQQFSLGIKEHDDTDKHFRTQRHRTYAALHKTRVNINTVHHLKYQNKGK